MNLLLQILNNLGESILSWWLWMTLATAVLAVIAFVLDRALSAHVGAAWRVLLHSAVVVRLATPLGIGIALPLPFLAHTPSPIPSTQPWRAEASAGATTTALQPPASVQDSARLGLATLVPIVYLTGVGLLLARWRRDLLRLSTIRDASTPRSEFVSDGLPVASHPMAGPILIGTWRPTLIVPDVLLEPASRAALEHVLAHERAHCRRFDPIVAAILHVVVVAAWPVLPVWFSVKRMRALMELAADEAAVRGLDNEGRRAYGRTLVTCASTLQPVGSSLAFATHTHERVAALLRDRGHWRRASTVATIALGLGLVACSGVTTKPDMRQTEAPEEPPMATRSEVRYDPLAGEYPQLSWLVNVFEMPMQPEIRADGTVVVAGGVKANGMAVFEAGRIEAIFNSVRSIPGAKLVAVPALMTKPGEEATISTGDQDKTGATIGSRSISVEGVLVEGGVETTSELSQFAGGFGASSNIGRRVIPEGGGVIYVGPGPHADSPWTVVVLRPTVIRSIDDYPFQTSGSVTSN